MDLSRIYQIYTGLSVIYTEFPSSFNMGPLGPLPPSYPSDVNHVLDNPRSDRKPLTRKSADRKWMTSLDRKWVKMAFGNVRNPEHCRSGLSRFKLIFRSTFTSSRLRRSLPPRASQPTSVTSTPSPATPSHTVKTFLGWDPQRGTSTTPE